MFSSYELTVTDIEHLNGNILLVFEDSDEILIIQSSCEHFLLLYGFLNGIEFVPKVSCPFKIEILGRRNHFFLKGFLDLDVSSFQKIDDVLDHQRIFLL